MNQLKKPPNLITRLDLARALGISEWTIAHNETRLGLDRARIGLTTRDTIYKYSIAIKVLFGTREINDPKLMTRKEISLMVPFSVQQIIRNETRWGFDKARITIPIGKVWYLREHICVILRSNRVID